MIVAAQPKQFSMKEDGKIYFQPDSTNPLPGDVLATIAKGESLLQPAVTLVEGRDLGAEKAEDVLGAVQTWLKAHIYTVLEPLFNLVSDENLAEPVKEIAFQLFAHTGIVPRGDVESAIAKLDTDMRKVLRDKKVRLGPLLVFLPDLNKPAAVKLRAVLWSLYNDKALPPVLPHDGAMSVVVDVTTADPVYFRAIGYPLYGPRVIRIDMLDRVINAIYDSADAGKFQAQHKMAEWMGCPIADLYGILEAMGHRHIIKPVEEKTEVKAETVAEEKPADVAPMPEGETPTVAGEPKKQEQKKPELDWFFLRRGKAHTEQAESPPKREFSKPDKKSFPAERFAPKGQKLEKKTDFKKKKFDKKDNKRDDKSDRHNPRVYSAEASEQDNPFAVLQNLKIK